MPYLVDGTLSSIAKAYASPDEVGWKEVVFNETYSILSNKAYELTK